jgi:two-component system, NarL family, invasion response regulator UvrY
MSTQMKRILIADDHYILRKGLKHILTDEYGAVEFGEAENGDDAIQKLKEKKWDIFILDINMSGKGGLEVLKEMKKEGINVPVLVLSMHPEDQIAIHVLRLGAFGYLTKEAADAELINAVNKILCNEKYISPGVAVQLLNNLDQPLSEN